MTDGIWMRRYAADLMAFCLEHGAADGLQARLLDGDGLVTDMAETHRADWGDDMGAGLLEWLCERGRPARVRVAALRRTGERCGPDDCWETLGERDLRPPSGRS